MKHWRVAVIALVVLILWSLVGLVDSMGTTVYKFSNAIDYLSASWPPEIEILPSLVDPIVETLQMGLLGVTIGGLVAAPLSFLAARETAPHVLAYIVTRGLISTCRSIPALLWAILFVTMVGLGPVAGVFALATHCIGSLGKHFSESIETMYPHTKEIREAMEVDGAGRIRALYHGLLPALAPLFLSYFIYYVEWSVRAGTILGLVGAGGLGLRLTMAIRMFRRQETAAIVLTVLVMVSIIDGFSRLMRKQVLGAMV